MSNNDRHRGKHKVGTTKLMHYVAVLIGLVRQRIIEI